MSSQQAFCVSGCGGCHVPHIETEGVLDLSVMNVNGYRGLNRAFPDNVEDPQWVEIAAELG